MSLSWAFVEKCSVNSDMVLKTLINSTLSSTSDWNYAVKKNSLCKCFVDTFRGQYGCGRHLVQPALPCSYINCLGFIFTALFHGFIFTQLKWAHCVCVFQYIALKKCGSLPSWQWWGCHRWSACACEDIVREQLNRNGLAEKKNFIQKLFKHTDFIITDSCTDILIVSTAIMWSTRLSHYCQNCQVTFHIHAKCKYWWSTAVWVHVCVSHVHLSSVIWSPEMEQYILTIRQNDSSLFTCWCQPLFLSISHKHTWHSHRWTLNLVERMTRHVS